MTYFINNKQIIRSIHYCPEGKQKYYYKDYYDMLTASINHAPTSTSIPLANGSRIELIDYYNSYRRSIRI